MLFTSRWQEIVCCPVLHVIVFIFLSCIRQAQSLFLKSFLAFGCRRRRLVLPPCSVWAVPFLPPVTFKRRCQTKTGSAIWSPLDNTRDSVLVMADTVDTFSKHCIFQVSVEPRRFSRSHTCVVLRCYTLQCVVYVCVCVFFLRYCWAFSSSWLPCSSSLPCSYQSKS